MVFCGHKTHQPRTPDTQQADSAPGAGGECRSQDLHQLPLDRPRVESPPRFPLYPSVKVPLGMTLDLPSILFMAGRPQEANPKQAGSAGPAPVLTPLPQKRGPAMVPTQDPKRAATDTGSGGTMGHSPLLGVSSLLLGLMLAARTIGSSVAVSRRFHVGEGTAAHSPADPTPRVATTGELALQWGCSQVWPIHEPQSPCLDEASWGPVPALPSSLLLCPAGSRPDGHFTATGRSPGWTTEHFQAALAWDWDGGGLNTDSSQTHRGTGSVTRRNRTPPGPAAADLHVQDPACCF